MSGVNKMKACLGQANGPEVELIVSGTQTYSTYETPSGYPAIYDDDLGLFCYARLVAGRFTSTGVSVTDIPPEGVVRHAEERPDVRAEQIAARTESKQQATQKRRKDGEP